MARTAETETVPTAAGPADPLAQAAVEEAAAVDTSGMTPAQKKAFNEAHEVVEVEVIHETGWTYRGTLYAQGTPLSVPRYVLGWDKPDPRAEGNPRNPFIRERKPA